MKSVSTPYTLPSLEGLLLQLRDSARTEREKGTYFENLVRAYFGYEDSFRELYSDVWTYAEWAKLEGIDGKDTGIVNDWAVETMGNPKYPLELFLRVITVSLETMKIVRSLPKLELP